MAEYRSVHAETSTNGTRGRHRAETKRDRIIDYFRRLFRVEVIN